MNFKEFKREYEHKKVTEYDHLVDSNPVVSVCVITYNHGPYIKDCLDGILMQQTDFPFEILVGEDDSTDGTRRICIEYAEKYPDKIRLFMHHRENNIEINESPTGWLNILYNYYSARGKYLAFCEGDDYWTDQLKLQKQVDFLEENKDCTLCFHKTKVIWADNYSKDYFQGAKGIDSTTKFSLTQFINSNNRIGVRTVAMMLRSEVVSDIPDWFCCTIHGDLAAQLLCGYRGKYGYIPEEMAVYNRAIPGSWSENHLELNWILRRTNSMNYCYNLFDKYSKYRYHKFIQKRNKKWIYKSISYSQRNYTRWKQLKLFREYYKVLLSPKKKNFAVWMRFLLGINTFKKVIKLKYDIF